MTEVRWIDTAGVVLLGELERLDSRRFSHSAPRITDAETRWDYQVQWRYADIKPAVDLALNANPEPIDPSAPYESLPVHSSLEQPWQRMWEAFMDACAKAGYSADRHPYLSRSPIERHRDGFRTTYYACFP